MKVELYSSALPTTEILLGLDNDCLDDVQETEMDSD